MSAVGTYSVQYNEPGTRIPESNQYLLKQLRFICWEHITLDLVGLLI